MIAKAIEKYVLVPRRRLDSIDQNLIQLMPGVAQQEVDNRYLVESAALPRLVLMQSDPAAIPVLVKRLIALVIVVSLEVTTLLALLLLLLFHAF